MSICPCFIAALTTNSSVGHAFVCDGYDENDYFHFNWGLSGCDNAWCPIGALNYASYSFNTETGFTGHIVPKQSEYYSRPDSIANMQIVENVNYDGVKLQWTNPMLTVGGDDLASITSVTIRRNRVVIAELTDAQVGANMEYEDNGLEPGLYEYAIYVTNEAGISQTVYRSVIVGEKCDITFQLHDSGGDGWKGASISVTSESGQRIAIVGMDEGSEKTVTLPLLKGNLNFIWNHGWFHSYPGWDTDNECSFNILNADGEEIYASTGLQAGVFLTYENDCEPNDIAEFAPDESVQIYPNPTNGLLNVSGNGTMHIIVSNLLGQKIMEVNAEGNITLNLNGYGSGTHLVRIESANGVMVQKVNLQK